MLKKECNNIEKQKQEREKKHKELHGSANSLRPHNKALVATSLLYFSIVDYNEPVGYIKVLELALHVLTIY